MLFPWKQCLFFIYLNLNRTILKQLKLLRIFAADISEKITLQIWRTVILNKPSTLIIFLKTRLKQYLLVYKKPLKGIFTSNYYVKYEYSCL